VNFTLLESIIVTGGDLMGMRFILGKPGTGKTNLCLMEINGRLTGTAPLYYLVPEQFSLQSEKLLLSNRSYNSGSKNFYEGNISAATQVQVLSFNRLAYRLFALLGNAPGKLADDLGKQMLLRKVLFEVADKLTYYKAAADKHGFVDSLANTITEMNQYRITSNDLLLRAEQASSVGLKAKLTDIAIISGAYRQLVTGRYLLTDDMLEILCEKLDLLQNENTPLPLLDGSYFWVDGFSGFTPQEQQVLKYIMKRAELVSVTLTTDLQLPSYSPPQITIDKLTKLANSNGIKIKQDELREGNYRHKKCAELAHFVQNFSVLQNKAVPQFHNTCEAISIISAADRYAAVNTAANYILQLIQTGSYRFRDIAILCGDRTYEKVLQITFDRLNIPLFVDTETDILSHPLTELIRAALDIIVRNWSYESVFRFLKTRMAGLPLETVDIMENYVLEHGVRSYRWNYNFTNSVAEHGRIELMSKLSAFSESRKKASVQTHCKRIFDMLYCLNVPATLQEWYDACTEAGDHATAKIHKQIWPKICEIFDKLVEMLGDEEVTIKTFAATLDAGFAQVGLGRVPPTTDQVVIGDISRSRYPEIRAMVVLGANENVLPPTPSQSGLFTDQERQTLRNEGVELAAESIFRMAESDYSLYCALSQPSEKLILIYSEAETSGKPLRPSPMVGRIQEMFPNIKIKQSPEILEYDEVSLVNERVARLSEESVNLLYGNVVTTAVSRLESFARCPFAYFMTYIMKAKSRKKFEVLPTDLGSLFHDVLAQFSKNVWENCDGDIALSRTEIAQYVDNIINIITANSNVFQDTARNRHVLSKVHKVSTASIWALCEHIRVGAFVPTLAEQEIHTNESITLSNGKKLNISGYVDRVDTLNVNGEEYLKIIDYKSGNTKFNIDEVRIGVQLQLMIYMNVLTVMRNAKPGGVFYFPLDDPLFSTDILLSDELRDVGLLKQFKMSGIAIADDVAIAGLDKTLEPGTGSNVIPVAINKDGRYKKSSQPTALSIEEFRELDRTVNEKVKELGERMTSGDISQEPYIKGPKSPCNYCEFGAICGNTM